MTSPRFAPTLRALTIVGVSLVGCSSDNRSPASAEVDGGAGDAKSDGGPAGIVDHDGGSPLDDGGSRLGDGSTSGEAASSTCTPAPAATFDPLATFKPTTYLPDVTVTSTADGGAGSLRAALVSVRPGGVVAFAPALAGKTITLASTLALTQAVTIDGSAAPGLTLDGSGSVALVSFNGDSPTRLVFQSLQFAHGHTTGSGGAISLNGGALDVDIGGCTFQANAGNEGGAVRVGYAKGSNVSVHDSVFTNNDGSVGGGDGFSGGGLSAIGTNLTVARCRFENNTAPTVGGLYTIHADPRVSDTVFVGNRTSSSSGGTGGFGADGGGPGDDNNPGTIPGQVTLSRVRFENNIGASTDGGGAAIWGYPLDVVTLTDTVFHANQNAGGAKGGALRLHARTTATISRAAFVANTSTDQGGGVWFDGEGPVTFENVLFDGNGSQNDRGGGAWFDTGDVTLRHVTFADNTSGVGCGAFFQGGGVNVHIHNSIVANNTAMNTYEGQTGRNAIDQGGNIEWPAPPDMAHQVALGGMVADPLVTPVSASDGTWVATLAPGSPAIGLAVAPIASTDERGARRPAHGDSGAWQSGASCP